MLHGLSQLQAVIEVSSDEGLTWTPAPEYKPDIQDKACSAYIEAVTGNRFRILFRNTAFVHLRKELLIQFEVDGHGAANRLFKRNTPQGRVEGVELDLNTVRPFAFSKVSFKCSDRDDRRRLS